MKIPLWLKYAAFLSGLILAIALIVYVGIQEVTNYVVYREYVDLGDEATRRGVELQQSIRQLRDDALTRAVRFSEGSATALDVAEWNELGYRAAFIWEGDRVVPAPTGETAPLWAELQTDRSWLDKLVEMPLLALELSPIMFSSQPNVPNRSIWAAVRLPAESQVPRILLVMLDLDPILDRIGESPRHLTFLIDQRGRYVMHPQRSVVGQVAAGGQKVADPGYFELELLRSIGKEFSDRYHDPQTNVRLRGWTVTTRQGNRVFEELPLLDKSIYFAETEVIDLLPYVEEGVQILDLEKTINDTLADVRSRAAGSEDESIRVGRFSADLGRLRIRAGSREQIQQITDRIEDELRKREIRADWTWRNPQLCRQFKMHVFQIDYDPPGQKGTATTPRYFRLVQLVSREEIEDEIASELRAGTWFLLAIGLAVPLAIGLSMFMTRSLNRITAAAVSIAQLKPNSNWDREVEELTVTLPTQRRDEIGVLARAVGQMLQQISIAYRSLKTEADRLDQE